MTKREIMIKAVKSMVQRYLNIFCKTLDKNIQPTEKQLLDRIREKLQKCSGCIFNFYESPMKDRMVLVNHVLVNHLKNSLA